MNVSRNRTPGAAAREENVRKPDKETCKMLVVDDDPTFSKIIKGIAAKKDVSVICALSLDSPELLEGTQFNVAIIDYDLGISSGLDLAKILQKMFGNIPILIVSQTDRKRTVNPKWPASVREFLNKNIGHERIFEKAVTAWQVWKTFHR